MEGPLRLLLVVLVPAVAISTIVVVLVVPPVFLTLWFVASGGFIGAKAVDWYGRGGPGE